MSASFTPTAHLPHREEMASLTGHIAIDSLAVFGSPLSLSLIIELSFAPRDHLIFTLCLASMLIWLFVNISHHSWLTHKHITKLGNVLLYTSRNNTFELVNVALLSQMRLLIMISSPLSLPSSHYYRDQCVYYCQHKHNNSNLEKHSHSNS